MKRSNAHSTASAEALEAARKRRKDEVEWQENEITNRISPVIMRISKTITSSEKRLIEFITKGLSLDILLDIPVADFFI